MVAHTTAKTHVSRILTKLDARDRAQLVVIAYESGLVVPGGESTIPARRTYIWRCTACTSRRMKECGPQADDLWTAVNEP